MIYSLTFLLFSIFLFNLTLTNTILFTQGAAAATESEEGYYYEEEEEPHKPLRIVFRPKTHLYLHPARKKNLKKEYRTLGRGISKQTKQQRDKLNINPDEIEVEKEVVEKVMEGRVLDEEKEEEDRELVLEGKKKRKKRKKKRMLEEEVNGIVARKYLDQINPVSNNNNTSHNHHNRTKHHGRSQKYGTTNHKQHQHQHQQPQQHSKTKSKQKIPITPQPMEETGKTTSIEQGREIEISNDIKTNPNDNPQTNPQNEKNVPTQTNSTTTTDTNNDKSSTTNQQPQPLDSKPDDLNPQNNPPQTANSNVDENEDDDISETILLVFMICLVVFALTMIRKKWKNRNSFRYDRIGSGGGSVADDDLTYGVSTVGGGGGNGSGFKSGGVFQNRQESVPLTPADNDDEWGWEDGSASGEIELGNHTTSSVITTFSSPSSPRTTTSGLQKTLDRSLSDARQKQRRLGSGSTGGGGGANRRSSGGSSNALRRTSGGSTGAGSVGVVGPSLSQQQQRNSLKKVVVKDSWDEDDVEGGWGGGEGEVGRILMEQKKCGIPTITSLGGLSSGSGGGGGVSGMGKANANATSTRKKKKEEPDDDIFASMGLTSMGGVGVSTGGITGRGAVPVSGVHRVAQTKPETWKSSGLSNEGDGEGGGSDWDDDLDDLLDD